MAARKKATKKKAAEKNFVEVTFRGGPRDGDTMHLCNPPPLFIRLAFPEWCNYFLREGTTEYDYNMEREPIPHRYDFREISKKAGR